MQFNKSNQQPPAARDFHGLGIVPKILDILEHAHFKTPTPIQHQAIPVAISGKDVIGIAQTGTGKTLAFGIPMVQQLAQTKTKGLVVLPTRELAVQVYDSLQSLTRAFSIGSTVLIGGASMSRQRSELSRQPRIIIATPGRLLDHMSQRGISLTDVGILVLDEADRMLDMGFEPQIRRILSTVPKQRQTMLFSATMPTGIVQIASQYMRMPVRVEVAPAGTMIELVTHELFFVSKEEKVQLLESLLKQYMGSVLVFCRTRFGAEKAARAVKNMGFKAAEIHSDRSQSQRLEALNGFRDGKYRVLVATDIAARGIDVHNIELVVNYDLPDKPDDYIHRIGRTGRAGMKGHAISFATPDQRRDVKDIEHLVRQTLPISRLPELPQRRSPPPQQPYMRPERQEPPERRRPQGGPPKRREQGFPSFTGTLHFEPRKRR